MARMSVVGTADAEFGTFVQTVWHYVHLSLLYSPHMLVLTGEPIQLVGDWHSASGA
jgi:hypothetical protein